MPVQWRRQQVRLEWGRMCTYTAGEGPPLLLLHGLGGSGRYWAGALGLAARRTLVAPDLPGFGRSDKPRLDYSSELHVSALTELLARLGIGGSLDLAGHSMGGILAALFASRHPGRAASLALIASPFPRRQLHPFRMPGSRVSRTVYRTVQRLLPLVSPVVRSQTFPRAVVADYLRHTLESYQGTSQALIWDPTLADELADLEAVLGAAPQLLLYSDQDRTIGSDNLDHWRRVLPQAEVIVIPGAHQLLLRDHFATLAAWYDRVDAAVRA